jgi:Cellulase (glycosyl hydrolase family 5)
MLGAVIAAVAVLIWLVSSLVTSVHRDSCATAGGCGTAPVHVLCSACRSPVVLHSTRSEPFVTPGGAAVRLRAVNMIPVWRGLPGSTWQAWHYRDIAREGFNAVRFVLYWDVFEPRAGGFDQVSLRTLDLAIRRAGAAGLYVILDEIHLWGPHGMNDVPSWARAGDTLATVAAHGGAYLRLLAARYRRWRTVAAYDLVNEFHHQPLDQNAVLRVYDRLIGQIRQVDSGKIVLIEPTYGDTSIAGSLADFANLTHRSNVVWSIHDYFAGGDGDGYRSDGGQVGDYTWDGHTGYDHPDVGQLREHLLTHIRKMREVGLPIWIGEFGIGAGAMNHDEWIADQVALFARYGLGYAWWEYSTRRPFSATNRSFGWEPWVRLLVAAGGGRSPAPAGR